MIRLYISEIFWLLFYILTEISCIRSFEFNFIIIIIILWFHSMRPKHNLHTGNGIISTIITKQCYIIVMFCFIVLLYCCVVLFFTSLPIVYNYSSYALQSSATPGSFIINRFLTESIS